MDEQRNQIENQPSRKGFLAGMISQLLFIWDFLKIVLIAVVIIIPIRYFVFQPFIVSGASMEPNFHNGQYLIIDELSYYLSEPKRGQVVVMRYPRDRQQYFIKRVIGLPGEKIEIDSGHVLINGQALTEFYLESQNLTFPHSEGVVSTKKSLTLGANQYFMMGDNRGASSDSRDWGPLDRKDMVGKVLLRVLPVNQLQIFLQAPEYSL